MKTEILFIMDRSGSMASAADAAVAGFNEFLQKQQDTAGNKVLSLLQFDTDFDYTYQREEPKNCKPLINRETYRTRGMTSLHDAIGRGLSDIKSELAVVAIYTDGYENSSQEWTQDAVKKLVEEKQAAGWEILFMASDMSKKQAINLAGGMGVMRNATAVVGKSPIQFSATMDSFHDTSQAYLSAGKADDLNLQSAYDVKLAQKEDTEAKEASA